VVHNIYIMYCHCDAVTSNRGSKGGDGNEGDKIFGIGKMF